MKGYKYTINDFNLSRKPGLEDTLIELVMINRCDDHVR